MSEQPEGPPRRRGGNIFTNRIGPLPMWAWVAIIGGALIAWRLYSNRSGANTSSQAGTTTTPSTPADQVPQFVNQFYLSGVAPTSTGGTAEVPGNPAPVVTPPTTPTIPGLPTVPSGSQSPTATAVKQFPAPTGLRATPSGNGVSLIWNTVPSGTQYPGSYTVAIYNGRGKAVSQTTVATPDTSGARGTTTMTGLASKTSYHANVWANGGLTAPPHATVSFRTT